MNGKSHLPSMIVLNHEEDDEEELMKAGRGNVVSRKERESNVSNFARC